MMSKRQSRWHEALVNSKIQKPSQKTGGKEAAVPVSNGGSSKVSSSTKSKTSICFGRSITISTRGGDPAAGGSLKRGSLPQPQGSRPAARTSRSALRLSSSFSSLHTSSLPTAPFMRSSRSLSRLDQRPSRDDSDQVKRGRSTERKGQISSSEEELRENKEESHDEINEKMKTSSSSKPAESPASECHRAQELNYSARVVSRSSLPRYLRLKALRCRDAEAFVIPDLLSFKRGWMMLQDASGQWHKHWFVLTDQILRFFKDSIAEEAADVDGEINLSTCFDITEYPAQRNCGFQIHTRDGVYTLCAMTSGMRRNWVQAVLKNVRPSPTTDVTISFPEQHPGSQSAADGENIILQDLPSSECAEETHQHLTEREQSPADGSASPSTPSAPSPAGGPQRAEEKDEGVVDPEGPVNENSTTTLIQSHNTQKETEQSWQQNKMTPMGEDQQTGQLVKELEQTQRELSRLQQLNRSLQEELQQERDIAFSNSSSGQSLTFQRLHKMNQDLRSELEAQKASQEEAREAELRRRVDLLAQQAQLLVTGDATALAQAHMEQDRRRFHELQVEWERRLASLKSQLSASEERRKDAESRLTQLQQELEGFHGLQQEANRLQKHLQEVTTQLQAHEEAQTQKEARLQRHLTLLQESQERERRSLTSSLKQAEQHSQQLQERLDRAEEEVGNLSKTQSWTREIERAQQQLQEELTCTISTVEKLQEEREQLSCRCQELQNQLAEADGEVSRLQNRLKTDETHYYNLEHSYERVCEELQVALGKVRQKEADTQDMREGYEGLLDRKEQELSEVLLKMEVLGNSLEETEVRLHEVTKACTCSDALQNEGPDLLAVKAPDQTPKSSHLNAVLAAEEPERFVSVIQTLESKLYATEEKLRDIMQRLEEHQGHVACQDPHLCSQLTRSRATAQHLSLLLHSQAKQSQRFAQETEGRCRMLAGRFQVAANIVQACRDRLQATPIDTAADLEKQLATVVACLQQGEKEAVKQQHESINASKGEDKILNETFAEAEGNGIGETKTESVEKCLRRELFVVEKMVSALKSQCGFGKLVLQPNKDEGSMVHKYRSIISQTIALKTEKIAQSESLESVVGGVCAEAELIYSTLKLQQQYLSGSPGNNEEVEHLKVDLADVSPSELASYEEQGGGVDGDVKPIKEDESDEKKAETEKEPRWLERLTSRLQRRARCLRQIFQEIGGGDGDECGVVEDDWENASAVDVSRMQEQAKLIYISERLYADMEQQLRQSESLLEKLQAACKEQDVTLKEEQEAFKHTLSRLQEDNSALRDQLERAEEKIVSVESGNQRLLEDTRRIEGYHEERMKNLEEEFHEKIRELQHIHEEEMKHVHGYYTKTCVSREKLTKAQLKDPEKAEASCDEGLAAMEEMHKQLMADLQQQHQQEVAALLKEKDQMLQEETAATMAAIVAMRRAHKQELERSRQSQHIKDSADITQLNIEHEKDIQLLQKELEVLSVQHTQKCLENCQLSQELQEERQSLLQYQRENQELKKKQREADEMSQMHFSLNGKQPHVAPQLNDFYEMEVILRAREAEMQFLRQEARALREELKIARMDKIYAQNKLKALYTNSQEEPHHDGNTNTEDVKFPTWSPAASGPSHESTGTNTSNTHFLKKPGKSSLTRQIRGMRSKSLKEGLSVQERMKLFESS